eukprot:5723509-Prymnesium_polylepis.1
MVDRYCTERSRKRQDEYLELHSDFCRCDRIRHPADERNTNRPDAHRADQRAAAAAGPNSAAVAALRAI